MPLIKSAKKALRVSRAKEAINDVTRAKIKSAVKGVRKAALSADTKTAEFLTAAYRELDLAAKKNVIHKKKASRLKSRLAKVVAKGGVKATVKKKSATKKKK